MLLQQHIAVGRKEGAGQLDLPRQLPHQEERAGGLPLGLRYQHGHHAVNRADGLGREQPGGPPHGPGGCDREIFALRAPAAGNQPFAGAAAHQGWLGIVRPGNIGSHGYNEGFRGH